MAEQTEISNPQENSEMNPYPEEVLKILRRSPEEKTARAMEVLREAKIMSVENLQAAGFYSKEELNTVTWELLQDPNYSNAQRRRIQAIRDSALR